MKKKCNEFQFLITVFYFKCRFVKRENTTLKLELISTTMCTVHWQVYMITNYLMTPVN